MIRLPNRRDTPLKPVPAWVLVLCGAAAAVWTVNAALHIAYDTGTAWKALNGFCALLWWAVFGRVLLQWRLGRK